MTKAGALGYVVGLMKASSMSAEDLNRGIQIATELQLANPKMPDRKLIEEAAQRLYDEKQPSVLEAALAGGLPSMILSGMTTHLLNKGERPGLALGAGLGAGTLFGGIHAIRQAIENAQVRKRKRARELMAV